MKFGPMTFAAGAVIAMASLPTSADAAGLIGAARPDSNVQLVHYDHRDCQSDHGDWHRHGVLGGWRDCAAPAPYVASPPPYVAPPPAYGSGPYYGNPYRRPGIGVYVGGGGGGGVGVSISDERLKSNIVRLASLDGGIGLYEYSLTGETRRRVGVMAQEVAESAPHAVLRDERGYYLVDYDALFADQDLMASLERSGYQLAP